MKYNLGRLSEINKNGTLLTTGRRLLGLLGDERRVFMLAVLATLVNSFINLGSPFLLGYIIDHCIRNKDFGRILTFSGLLAVVYVIALAASYFQTRLMGGIGQRLLFRMRNGIFHKMQTLPIAFFNANKTGDLISRINNDTDKLNGFFSDSLAQFVGCVATIVGSTVFLLTINFRMGIAALAPGIILLIFTRLASPIMNKMNMKSRESEAELSAEIHESLSNFRVIVAFNRRNYFLQRFAGVNRTNYKNALMAGATGSTVFPVYNLCANLAQLILLITGIYLLKNNALTVGVLISYFLNVTNFYNPIKMLAPVWTQFKNAMSSLDRVDQLMELESDLPILPAAQPAITGSDMVELRNVHFGYVEGKEVLHNVSFRLQKGKKYSFIGPTGGGKTTIASLIARLYDPAQGVVLVDGRDVRTYSTAERCRKIGFILQDPFVFTGTVRENILYGNEYPPANLEASITEDGLDELIGLFADGLDTKIVNGGTNISIGQKQLISFIRTVLRKPEILIMDEASANIDFYTEQLLEAILDRLPADTTCITIAHRLNTIENADEIFFVNAGEVSRTRSFDHAISKLINDKRVS